MKVYNLCCAHAHPFEGWFSSEEDFLAQSARHLIACPLCADTEVERRPSAPRLNLSGAQAPTEDGNQKMQTALLQMVREVIDNTEDVGSSFADEARRIHYKEAPERGIRGVASQDQHAALIDEGIDVLSIPMTAPLKHTLQ